MRGTVAAMAWARIPCLLAMVGQRTEQVYVVFGQGVESIRL